MWFWIFILSVIGLADAAYLLYKKLKKEKLVCFFGEDCNKVSKSKYGYFFGIPNEIFGIGFYLFALSLFVFSLLGVITIFEISLTSLLLFAVILASIVSLYLLWIQTAVLKAWCAWCILSSLVNFLILFAVLFLR